MHHNGRTPYRGKNNDGPGSYSAPPSLLPAVLSRLGLPTAPDSSLAMEDRTHSDTRDRAWYARAEAVRALGKLGKQAPLEQVLVAMDDEHEMVRAVAIHTAGLLGKRVPLKKIIAALQDPAWHVREVAALTLASIGKRVPLEPLLAALSDPADPVRSAAHEALQQAHPDLVFESPSQVEESSPQEKANEVTQTFSLQSSAIFWQPKPEVGEPSVQIQLPKTQQERGQHMEINHVRTLSGKARPAYFTTIAAVVCLVLVVGSLLLTFNLVQRSKNTTGGTPVIVDTTPHLYVRSGNSIFKMDLASGKVIWKYTVTDYVHNNISVMNQEIINSPVIAGNGMVFFNAQNNHLYALDASNGKLLWRRINHSISVSEEVNGVLYATSSIPAGNDTTSELFALNARDGSERWHYSPQRLISWVTVAHGRLYLTEDNNLEALNAINGAILWKTQVQKAANDYLAEPQVVGNILYMQYIKFYAPPALPVFYVYAFDPVKGTELWHSQGMNGAIASPVTIANGIIYFGSEGSGAVYALSARDGHQLWKSNAGGVVVDSPQVANNVVYVGALDNSRGSSHIVAFDAASGKLRWTKTPRLFEGLNPDGLFVSNNGLIYCGTMGTTSEIGAFSLDIDVLQGTDGSIVRSYKISVANPPGFIGVMIAP